MDHKQVITKFGFLVDEKLKDIIELLNDNNYYTVNSCQNQEHLNNVTWICFDADVVNDFMIKIFAKNIELYDYLSYSDWEIICDVDHEFNGQVLTSLRFPSKDLEGITKTLKQIFKSP